MSFFFQVSFPKTHKWQGYSLAFFACTHCSDEDHFIPETIDGPLSGINVPEEYLRSYQKNFRILVFRTVEGVARRDDTVRVAFRPITFEGKDENCWSKIGGNPLWLMEDETPGTLDGRFRPEFLLQIELDLEFPLVEGAPKQREFNMPRNQLEELPDPFHKIFPGNALYFFGYEHPSSSVYIVTQCD